MPVALYALFLAAFAYGTTEFVIAGVLPQVAAGLGVSVPSAGYLVSGYAIGIAVGGPLLTIATARIARKTLLLCLAIAFTIGQAACALAPDFAWMLLLRVVVATSHGVYFGVAMVAAVGMVGSAQRGMAVAIILAGLTVSGVIGVPLGAAIGEAFGWRATFWAMFALGLAATAAIAVLVPASIGASGAPAGLLNEVKVLGRQQAWTSLIQMLMLMMGQFVPYTYIAPLLLEVTRLDPSLVPWALLASGVGSTIGVLLGGRLDNHQPMFWLIALQAAQAAVLILFYLASPYSLPIVLVLIVWGGLNFAIGTLIQTRILTWTADAPSLASSLIPAGFNVGIALAAFIGAMLLNAGYGYRSLPLLGVAAMFVAVIVSILSHAQERRSGLTPPAVAEPTAAS